MLNRILLYSAAVKNRRAKLSKSLKDRSKREDFLRQTFSPPAANRKCKYPAADASLSSPPRKKTAFDSLCEDVVKMTSRRIVREFTASQQTVLELEETNRRLEKENARLQLQNQALKNKLAHHNTSRCNQALQRKDKSIQMWRSRYHTLVKQTRRVVEAEKDRKLLTEVVKKQQTNLRKMKKRRQQQKKDRKKQVAERKVYQKAVQDQHKQLQNQQQEILYLEDQLTVSQDKDAGPGLFNTGSTI